MKNQHKIPERFKIVRVSGYYKKDGTYVQPYKRSIPKD